MNTLEALLRARFPVRVSDLPDLRTVKRPGDKEIVRADLEVKTW